MADGSRPTEPEVLPATAGDATGRFGQAAQNLNVQVNAQNLNINSSNLAALERIVRIDPNVATEIVRITGETVRHETSRYNTGAICATVVCGLVLLCAAAVAIASGFLAGIAFFLACVVVLAVITVIFTGKVQDISWTTRIIPGARGEAERPATDDTHRNAPEEER